MPTIADIPQHLLQPDKLAEFVQWVSELEVPSWTRRELVHTYTRATGKRFAAPQITAMMRGTEAINGDQE